MKHKNIIVIDDRNKKPMIIVNAYIVVSLLSNYNVDNPSETLFRSMRDGSKVYYGNA